MYCNVGYFALAEIIHAVSGKPWEDYLRERIFAPLGMNDTRATSATAMVRNRADGYGGARAAAASGPDSSRVSLHRR